MGFIVSSFSVLVMCYSVHDSVGPAGQHNVIQRLHLFLQCLKMDQNIYLFIMSITKLC